MELLSVFDAEFKPYGKVLDGYDTKDLVNAMNSIPLPQTGIAYQASIDLLERQSIRHELQARAYGGMPIEIGMCWGWNTKLNCVEYHRCSEVNIGTQDFVLLVARLDDIEDGKLDTSKVKGFTVPMGVAVEIYAPTLHYAPCQIDAVTEFRVAIVLPHGTNFEYSLSEPVSWEDKLLRAQNKWLIAHPEASEASDGAYVGLTGKNIDLADQY